MKYIVIVAVLIIPIALSFFFYLSYRLNNAPDNGNLESAIDTEVNKFLRNVKPDALAIGVFKDGKSYVNGYGEEDPDENMLFQIGSITKVFTALVLQILCDEKVIHMEMTLDELIGKNVTLSPAAKRITLKQLATHTSGLPRVPKMIEMKGINKVGKEQFEENPYSYINKDFVFEYLALTDENHKVGTFVYSNYGMGLLGHILESVTRKSYESLLLEKILVPLSMNQTRITLTTEMQELLAQGYTSDGNTTPRWTFNALEGAGSLNSNAADMLKFIKANFDENTPISNALNKLQQSPIDDMTSIGWMRPGLVEKFFGNKNSLWHNGMVGGYASYLSIDSKARTGVFVAVNKPIDVTMLGIMLTRQVRVQSWSQEKPSDKSM